MVVHIPTCDVRMNPFSLGIKPNLGKYWDSSLFWKHPYFQRPAQNQRADHDRRRTDHAARPLFAAQAVRPPYTTSAYRPSAHFWPFPTPISADRQTFRALSVNVNKQLIYPLASTVSTPSDSCTIAIVFFLSN